MKNLTLTLLFYFVFATAGAQVTVSGALTGNGTYSTLGAAITAIGTSQAGADILISITANTTETTASIVIGEGTWTSLTIQPSGGAFTITANTVAGSPMIDLNGADNVRIDGLNTGGNALMISNTRVATTASTSTIRFINGATGNLITNCTLQGSYTSGFNFLDAGGTVLISTDAVTANGNDNNTISNNNIGPAGSNYPAKGICGLGSTTTTAIGNSGITITNNNIYDYFRPNFESAGIHTVNGCNTWTITGNRFYQTAARTWTSSTNLQTAINIDGTSATSGSKSFTITGNIIGYASSTQTGVYSLLGGTGGATGKFIGIRFMGPTGGAVTDISSNTIASISLTNATSSGTASTSPLTGIIIVNGVATTNNNTIGSATSTGSLVLSTNAPANIEVNGICGMTSDSWTANSNIIGGITVTNANTSAAYGLIVSGLRCQISSAKSFIATSNVIGGSVANSIQNNNTATTAQVFGIYNSSGASTLTANTIRNLTAVEGTGTGTSASVIGISTSTIGSHTVTRNVIYGLKNSSASSAVTINAINVNSSSTSSTFSRNLIHSLSVPNTNSAAQINGIYINTGTSVIQNNMIRLGIDEDGNSLTAATTLTGINQPFSGVTNNFYFNSVYIGGTDVANGSSNSYAFSSGVTSSARNIRNNIFFNARSNASAGGKHYAVRVAGTAPNPSLLTLNYNIYYTTGTGGVLGFFNSADVVSLADWRTAVGLDANSYSANPQYIAPDGNAATLDLHIGTAPSPVERNGINIATITDDFDGETRSALTPEDIGADAGNFNFNSLPLVWAAFNGWKDKTGNRLEWATASESDNTGFDVQRSADGVLFQTIGFVKSQAAGFYSNAKLNYQFTDGHTGNQDWFYRIRQLDRDGRGTLSKVILVKKEEAAAWFIQALYPVPAQQHLNLVLTVSDKSRILIELADVTGRKLLGKSVELTTGSHTVPMDIRMLLKGTYFIRVSGLDQQSGFSTATFVKQ